MCMCIRVCATFMCVYLLTHRVTFSFTLWKNGRFLRVVWYVRDFRITQFYVVIYFLLNAFFVDCVIVRNIIRYFFVVK